MLIYTCFPCSAPFADQDKPFEEFLGELLDSVFKKAGVLVEVAKENGDGDD